MEEDTADGISQAQKNTLKNKSHARGKSEVQKWAHVYRTCFPEDQDIPSPCKSGANGSFFNFMLIAV